MSQLDMATPLAHGSPRVATLRRRLREESVLIAVVAILLVVLALIPLVGTLFGSFWSSSIIRPGGTFTLANWPRVLLSSSFLQSLWNSFTLSLAVTAGSVAVGSALAFLLARTDVKYKRFVRLALYGNMMVSPFVVAAAWITLASPRVGLLNAVPLALTGTGWIDVYTFAGLVFVIVSHIAPFVFAFVEPAFLNFDSAREEAASVAGASTWRIIRTVSLPLARPAIVSVAITTFVLGLEMFAIPAILTGSSGISLLAVEVYRNLQYTPSRWQDSAVIGFTLIVIVSICLYVQKRVVGDSRRYVAIAGKGRNDEPLRLARLRNPISTAVLVYIIITCIVPFAALIYTSLSRYTAGLHLDASILTLDNFVTVFTSPNLMPAIMNSIKIGLAGAAILVLISVLTAVSVHGVRPAHFSAAWLDGLVRLPIALPAVVLGIGLLWAYFLVPLPIYGTLLILIIAAVTKYLPIIYSSVCASYIQLGHELREAAMVAGARTGRIIMDIDVPIMASPLFAAFMYAVVLASHEATASVMLYSPSSITLPILLWVTLEHAAAPTTGAVISLVSMVLTGLMIICSRLPGRLLQPRWRSKSDDAIGVTYE